MDAQMLARRAMESDLRKALAQGQFELHYQPFVNLASNEITGFEALIRWHHPEQGHGPARRLHSAGRRDRSDRADRRMGARGGLRHGRAMAG